ncbi:MAG: 23S rRNA (uracil(1939)-C(5))-methyltransferase RlmD [Erysipelotrichaceae bacterium]|nr:23S rRNA (uracil(1939)-C(5))-methyltransferase RlmD [Erysipelotrichaceae bacterium]
MKNQILRCKCVDMSVEGLGIARADKLVIFVKGLIKGEEADVKIIAEKKNYSIGIIDKLITESPYRLKSECPVAYKCGGCDYRHIAYDYQLQLKKEVLVNTFPGYTVKDILPCADPYYYRNKVQIPVSDHKMGFYRKYSNDIVEFDDCLIESKTANAMIKDLKSLILNTAKERSIRHILIKHGKGSGEVMLAFIVSDLSVDLSDVCAFMVKKYPEIVSVLMNLNDRNTNVILGTEEVVLYGRDFIYDDFDGIKVKVSLKSFYQINHDQMIRLYDIARKLADLDQGKEVLDLYCGIGTISLYLSRYAKHVTGVEIVGSAVENARDNAKLNQIDNCDFILADATKDMDPYLKNKDVVILDPPRKGVSRKLIDSLKENKIQRIVYISCNPATLARDLELFKEDYEIGEIYPVDMFPFTIHTECVTVLDRK